MSTNQPISNLVVPIPPFIPFDGLIETLKVDSKIFSASDRFKLWQVLKYISDNLLALNRDIVAINAVTIVSGTLDSARLNISKGNWHPAQVGVTLIVNSAKYWHLDTMTFVQCDLTWPVTADTTLLNITGLPFIPTVQNGLVVGFCINSTIGSALITTAPGITLWKDLGVHGTNSDMSGGELVLSGFYV